MIVTLSSLRGSPGVSSWAWLLAAAWPTQPSVERVVLEADADGGVFGARYGLGVDPGVARLVAAARRHQPGQPFRLEEVARRVGDRMWVIPGAESAEAAVKEWGAAAEEVAGLAAGDERVWLVDCGRLGTGSPSRAFVARSELSLVLCRARVEELVAMPSRLGGLRRLGAEQVGVMVIGRSEYRRAELVEFFGTGLLWRVRDNREVATLANLVLTQRRARRTWGWREALQVAAEVADRVTPPTIGTEGAVVEAVSDA